MSMSLVLNDRTLSIDGSLDRFTLGSPQCYNFPDIPGDVIIDLQDVKNTDTAGVAWLLKLVGHYQNTQHQVSIVNEPSQLIALAGISNVLNLLPLSHS